MTCDSPSLVDFAGSSDLSELDYGFVMDNVEQLLSMKNAMGPFRYIENPTLFAFEDVVQYNEGMKLEIMVKCYTYCLEHFARFFVVDMGKFLML